ncbi:phosphoenolpyruvate carboxylase [Bordetella pertussis]|nr:phosphoenolpyruvate carboxylase [Bordetella pertussis]CPJ65732.1 phosphoenolpyruvate carboxylase [Bordetella pertussis]CPM75337.1 phosphoenolpyruvate carboxylase [Bordetella pertussis]CPN40558.1 phosphoenolpyruvate carboxylase [Bordetella pertussis]CPO23136.1 phosphoenolpyruvate carboxylase [Bordetella pertussis]
MAAYNAPVSNCQFRLTHILPIPQRHGAPTDPFQMNAIRQQSDSAEPLRHDIRLLGRCLGEVIQACEGKRVYDTIETLRRTAVRFRRAGDPADDKLLQARVKQLRGNDPNSVARAFSYFLHLSNIAEDRDQNRRQRERALAGAGPERGSLRQAIESLKAQGVNNARIRRLLSEACVMPVLTAHPTEVQRKSTLDVHREISSLLVQRERELTADELSELDLALIGQVATLWQTRMLRYTRLTVADEIENALSYYRSTFLNVIPRVYGDLARLSPSSRSRRRPHRSNRSCAWAAGSAAIATAIPMSTPPRWNARCCGRPRCCSSTICRKSTRWAPNCRPAHC